MSCCSVAKLCLTPCDPMDCNPRAPMSMGLPRQEHWSGLPFPSPGDLPNPGIKPTSLAWQADSLPPSHWEAYTLYSAVLCPYLIEL